VDIFAMNDPIYEPFSSQAEWLNVLGFLVFLSHESCQILFWA